MIRRRDPNQAAAAIDCLGKPLDGRRIIYSETKLLNDREGRVAFYLSTLDVGVPENRHVEGAAP